MCDEDDCCCDMTTSKVVIASVGIGLPAILLISILVPLSLHRVQFDEVALAYNVNTKTVDPAILREGLHSLGLGFELIVFKTTQRNIFLDNEIMLTKDGLQLTVDIDIFFSVQQSDIFRIVTRFGDQPQHDQYLTMLFRSTCLEVVATFNGREFVDSRQQIQTALLAALRERASGYDVDATVDTVNLRNIDLPSSLQSAVSATTAAQADLQQAASERSAALQQAEIRLAVAKSQAQVTIIEAKRDASVLVQQAKVQVQGIQSTWQQRTTAFTKISTAMGRGGDFFVESYVRNLVLQSAASEAEKTLVV